MATRKKKAAEVEQEEEANSEELDEVVGEDVEDDSKSGANSIRCIIGPFTLLGDSRVWHVSSYSHGWTTGRVVEGKNGDIHYRPDQYHENVFEAVQELWKKVLRTFGDIEIGLYDDKEYFAKMKLFADVVSKIKVEFNNSITGVFGVIIHYNEQAMINQLSALEAKRVKKYLKGNAGKRVLP